MKKLELIESFTNKKEVILESYFEQENTLSSETICLIEKFLSYKSIKEALKNHFKIKSSVVVNFCQENMIREYNGDVFLNVDYFLAIESLSYIFSNKEKFNYSDFIQVMKSQKILAMLSVFHRDARRLDKFLKDNFKEDQIKTVLINTTSYTELPDLTGMFFQEENMFKAVLKNLSFNSKNNLSKCHDILSKYVENIKLENFELKQEIHNPQINELGMIDKNYSFSIPRSHKDLVQWGTELGHCIGSKIYADKAYSGRSILIGIESHEKIKYTIEIVNNKINQVQGYSRSKPNNGLMKKIRENLIEKKLLTT